MNSFSPLVFLQKALRRIPFAPFDVNCLHCLEYSPDHSGDSGLPAQDIEVREGTALDIERMAECRNFPERLPERFASKEHCVVATMRDNVIGYQWFCDKPSRIEERYGYRVEIPSDSLYGYDAFVRPDYRRAKVWTRFHVTYLKDLLVRLQRHRVIVMVDQGNDVSISAHLRLGYGLYCKVYVLKLFRKSLCIPLPVNTVKRPLSAAELGATEGYAGHAKKVLS
jgi:hypothetical protein